jgi:multidrug efflux system membrane fusion protein
MHFLHPSAARGSVPVSLLVLSLSLVTLSSSGCSSSGEQTSVEKRPPVTVRVASVEQKDIPITLRAVGTVEAYSTVTVKPQVGGILEEIHFREGQEVRKGDMLFTIDARAYQAAVAEAEANLARDQAQARQADEEVRRYTDLVGKDFVTQEQFEQIRTNADALRAALQANQAALDNARLQLSFCSIHSPVTGRTGSLKVHPGNVVKAEETELITIHQITPIYVRFSVPEQDQEEIRERTQKGELKVEAVVSAGEEKRSLSGSLTFIDNMVDRNTGTIQLKATFDNKERILWPGQFVEVELTLTTAKDAIVVATQTVQTGQQGDYVFVVKPDSTVELRLVEVQIAGEKETVIKSGIRAGETVVTDGQLNLIPGDRVVIVKTGQEGA